MTFSQASGVHKKRLMKEFGCLWVEICGGPPSLFFCPGILCRAMAPVLDVLLATVLAKG